MKHLNICVLLGLGMLSGCASNPPQQQVSTFDNFLKQYNFTQFVPSNQIVEPLSIITNTSGAQEFVSFPDDCSWVVSPNVKSSKTALSSLKKKVTNNSELNLDVANDLWESVDLGAVLGYSDITSIELEFINPYLKIVSRVSAQESFNSGSKSCKQAAANKSNLVIHQLLGVEGIKFKFIGSDGANINLNADLIEKANLKGELKREAEASGSIMLSESIYVGYRAFSGQLASGALSDRVAFTVLDPEEVKLVLSNESE